MLNLFKNHQNWLLSTIPNEEIDKPDLMQRILYKFITDFVERERGFENMSWCDDEGHKNAMHKIQKIYDWITIERPLLSSLSEQVGDTITPFSDETVIEKWVADENIEEYLNIRARLRQTDLDMMQQIVDIQDYLITV